MRALFGGDPVWRTPTLGGPAYFNKTARTMTLWDSETGGTQYTNLLAADGSTPISSVAITGPTTPRFYGEDNDIAYAWAEIDGDTGGRELIRGTFDKGALATTYVGQRDPRLAAQRKFIPATFFQPRSGVGSPSLGAYAGWVTLPAWLLDANTTETIGAALTDLPWDTVNIGMLWTVGATTTGNVRNYLTWTENEPGAVAGAGRWGDLATADAVPAVANEVKETPIFRGVSLNPGALVGIKLDRTGADASDTATVDQIVLGVTVSYADTDAWAGGPEVTVDSATAYKSFPGLTKLADDTTLYTAYRRGTSHQNDKGAIVTRTSTDGGVTWSADVATITDATYDVRDPNLTTLSDGTLVMTYFLLNNATVRALPDGLKVITSSDNGVTWSAPVTVDTGWTDYSACCGPVVELANGDLLIPAYGKDSGDTYVYSNVYRSTDGGATWAFLSTLANTGTDSHVETNLLHLGGTNVLAAIRTEGGAQGKRIQTRHSTDSGATWGPIVDQFAGTGAPHLFREASTQKIVATYRDEVMHAVRVRVSDDEGATWKDPLDVAKRSLYASCAQIAPGELCMVYSNEDTSSNAHMRARTLEVR